MVQERVQVVTASHGGGLLGFALRYSLRSLARNKKRSALVIATVALSTTVSIVGMSYASAVIRIWAQGAIEFGLGHAQVHTKAYWSNPEVLRKNHLIDMENVAIEALSQDARIKSFSRRIRFEGNISASGKTVYFLGIAVLAEEEIAVASKAFNEHTDAGRFVSSDDGLGIVIGKHLADNLGLGLGDVAVLTMVNLEGSTNATDVIVRGIVDVPLPSLSKRLMYMNLAEVQSFLSLDNKFTELALSLKNESDVQDFTDFHAPKLQQANLDLQAWYQIDPMIKRVERIGRSLVGFMCFLLFVSSGLSVANIVYLLVAERSVEIGTLMAIGAKPTDIRRLFFVESGVIAAIGAITGTFAATITIWIMDFIGVPFKSPFHSGLLEVHPQTNLLLMVIVAFAAFFICFLAAIMPSRAAARVQPVVAFRGQMT